MAWSTALKEPVLLPDGRQLRTLDDVRAYVLKLPDEEQTEFEWHTVAGNLVQAAEHGGLWLEFVRISFLQALLRDEEPRYGPGKAVGSEMKFGRRKLARDR